VVKKEKDTRLQRISVKKEDALTVTKRKNNLKSSYKNYFFSFLKTMFFENELN